ncbi:unnamed protein product [Chondrus crispus]|uniref:Uncharacterized protein n=1 Tax=Chondrus crispus TaxID=2769 RepID=R7QDU3_CHOCR|nr:unnamed protein product [Chondrus crispus]CDF35590.1 unnamed protein product [Chondrus crispus]|eukprot:XP_005715409.1 unnamed protein product [Chondrus crispus]
MTTSLKTIRSFHFAFQTWHASHLLENQRWSGWKCTSLGHSTESYVHYEMRAKGR